MLANERKQVVKELIALAEVVKIQFETENNNLIDVYQKIDELDEILEGIGSCDSWDADELKSDVFKASKDSTELQNLIDSVQEFRDELESDTSERNEYQAGLLEEKYIDMETVTDLLENEDYTTAEEIQEAINEAIEYLKRMKK